MLLRVCVRVCVPGLPEQPRLEIGVQLGRRLAYALEHLDWTLANMIVEIVPKRDDQFAKNIVFFCTQLIGV